MSNQHVLDWEQVMERLDNDSAMFFELVDMLFSDYEKSLSELRTAIQQSNHTAVDRKAHSLKSALGNLGAMQCYELASQLERSGKNSEIDKYHELLTSFENAVLAFRDAVDKKR